MALSITTEKNGPIQQGNLSDSDASTSQNVLSAKEIVQGRENVADNGSTETLKEVFDVKEFDPVLAKKMALVNQAIDDIGMTPFQWKLFFLNGFGYAVDSVRLCAHQRYCG
jgi:hypothetical protein